jgi:hypothetical protein
MGFLAWIVVGLIAGWLAKMISPGPERTGLVATLQDGSPPLAAGASDTISTHSRLGPKSTMVQYTDGLVETKKIPNGGLQQRENVVRQLRQSA